MPRWVQKAPYLVARTAVSSSAKLYGSHAPWVQELDTISKLNLPSEYMKFRAAYNSGYLKNIFI